MTATTETLATNEATEASADNATTQADRLYTQKELDDMMARTRSAVQKKIVSKYEDLGDPDELRSIVEQHRKSQQDQQLKRGEFEKVLQEKMSAKDIEIQKRDKIIEEFRLNTPIIDAAARLRAINPDQVKALVRGNIRLNGEGETEVLDGEGKVRYDDAGKPLSVQAYVGEWLQQNPHFVSPAPSTTTTKSSIDAQRGPLDVSKLDMRNPEHRKIYAEAQKQGRL